MGKVIEMQPIHSRFQSVSSGPRVDIVGQTAGQGKQVRDLQVSGENQEPFQRAPALSVILPTRNEAGNISLLVSRLNTVFAGSVIEAIFVDDSDDDTVSAIEAAQAQSKQNIRYLHRLPDDRAGGLGSAVVAGLRLAHAPYACVMDADLQHPPELIPHLLEKMTRSNADLAVASRYCQQGRASGLNGIRTAISRGFTTAAKLAFPGALSKVSDPMSGFFMVRTSAIDLDRLKPNGFKILLEILARHPKLSVTEVGFEFGKRHAGESKASISEGIRYCSHLLHLRIGDDAVRLAQFLSVGASGILVNLVLLVAITELLGLHYLLSVVLATQGSTLWNYTLTNRWVFPGPQARSGTSRAVLFFAMNNAALLLRGPMIFLLTAGLQMHYSLSALISLVVLAAIRFVLSDRLIWGGIQDMQPQRPYSYDIHGLITLNSEVSLPELQQFQSNEPIDQAMITVRVGRNIRDWKRRVKADPEAVHFTYDERLGPAGFSIHVAMSNQVDVLASPILRWSPHVLYTNVVEPILRWSLVKHGYALVHGACLAYEDKAYLVTARTDTGKTTTMLRILNRQRRATDKGAFLSDDLTLVSADGRVLSYPKPLTISSHTVAAIDKPQLKWHERLSLIIQSRLHSRDGRRLALTLANTRLPMATVNTIVQMLVPPPKYLIQRLVPLAKHARESRLAGMFVIERGEDRESILTREEAYETLMSNSDDAFGFPPYSSIAKFLQNSNGQDLAELERQIVAQAFANLPATLIRSSRMSWAERISNLVQESSTLPEPRFAAAPAPELALDVGIGGE